ncbi:MAG TPA: ABC transporter permease [Actinomycetota bacterium]|nr:ABC transporter permease [Actinomycetota bacterium]
MIEIATSRGTRRGLIGFFALLVVFLYAPILILALFSFNDGDVSFPLAGFTVDWYRRFFANPKILRSLERSAIVAGVSSLIAVALGVSAAIALVRHRFAGKSAVSALVFSPLVVPYLVFGVSLLVIFTAVDKFLTSTTGQYIGLGLHAIVIGHVVISLPYTVLTIIPLLERLNIGLEEAAKDLGASPGQSFRRVTLPLLMPALVSAFMIAFTLSFDEYAIASFLAGKTPTWPVYLFAQLRVPSQLPQLLAVSSVVLVVSLGVVVAAEVGRRVAERRYGDVRLQNLP